MTYSISKLDGITALATLKLKSAGIRTTEALLEAARTQKGRKQLAARIGVSEQQMLQWANVADCMRVPGISKGKAQLLRAAGVTTLREFTLRNPKRLAQIMKEANNECRLVRVLPSEKSIAQLIEQARKLPLKITY